MRLKTFFLLLTLSLACCLTVKAQQQEDTAFRKLYDQYYQLYNEPDNEKQFWEASEKLMAYYKKVGKRRS